MRIAVVAPRSEPATVGGAERAWAGLVGALGEAGHEASLVTFPVDESGFGPLTRGYRSAASLDTSAFDLVISSKYPAWIAPHPRHVLIPHPRHHRHAHPKCLAGRRGPVVGIRIQSDVDHFVRVEVVAQGLAGFDQFDPRGIDSLPPESVDDSPLRPRIPQRLRF